MSSDKDYPVAGHLKFSGLTPECRLGFFHLADVQYVPLFQHIGHMRGEKKCLHSAYRKVRMIGIKWSFDSKRSISSKVCAQIKEKEIRRRIKGIQPPPQPISAVKLET